MNKGLERFSVLVEGLDHPEGICLGADGFLYAGGEAGQIYRIDAEAGKSEELGSSGGFMLGVCSDSKTRIYCCDVAQRALLRFDPDTRDFAVYSNGTTDRPMVNPNWPVFDSSGNLYVTDSGHWKKDDGCIFRVDQSGGTQVWTDVTSNFPNGACISADERTLFVLESCTPALVAIAIAPDGAAGERRVVAELPGTVPDGVVLDEESNAYVLCYRPDRIYRVTPDGAVEVVAEDDEGTLLSAPTNGVFFGQDMLRFATGNLGRWHISTCSWELPGLALKYPELD